MPNQKGFNPYLRTILEGLRVPKVNELPEIPSNPEERAKSISKCGPGEKP